MKNTEVTDTDTSVTAEVPALNVKTRKTSTRLTDEQKSEIRALLATGMKQTEIAKQFGCTNPTISNISRGYKTLKPRTTKIVAPDPVTDHTVLKTMNKVFVG